MDTYVEAGPENQNRLFTELNSQNKSKGGAFVGFTDNRLSAIAQRRQIDLMNSPAFPEEAGSIAPMGASAIRGNVLQQYSGKGSALRGGTCVQMKAFKNFDEANDLELQDDANFFFGEGYNHYKKGVGGGKEKRVAFRLIAMWGGKVGSVVDKILHEQVKVGNIEYYTNAKATIPLCYCWVPPGGIWNQFKNKINITEGVKNNIKINPFVVTTKAKYPEKKNLITTSMYDHDHYSYVVKVEDNGNGKKGVMNGLLDNKNPVHAGYPPYAAQHVNSGNNKILDVIGQATEPYTKLAGEGARFMCVRNHMNALRDNTIFYYNIKGAYSGIKFSVLWTGWDHLFDKKFNIDDNTIIHAIQQQQLNGAGNIVSARDYSLDQHQSNIVADHDQQVKLLI